MFNSESGASSGRVILLDLKAGEITTILQVSEHVKVSTHWVNRPIMCPRSVSCSLCDRTGPPKEQAYFFADLGHKNGRPLGVVLVCMMMDLYSEISGSPNVGRVIELKRKKRDRSPIEGTWLESRDVKAKLGIPNVIAAIAKLFNLPSIKTGEAISDYERRITPIVRNKCDLAAGIPLQA